ncbi:DUF896 domain-containing protein [Sporolactobacillus kofuensis]|uniref:UPF0291 protein ACFP7A_11570 n=1 Tax=Sporolactobacillus kofuensis TaxID=269672 RepID=A0ABW1WJ44_9BACL|nr:DUF896 domain-containing protein [Sporolactobacillus kofuensis]MCO7176541.1 DUF896 domain-containing protein [Sporolactobacillus kofuensis]
MTKLLDEINALARLSRERPLNDQEKKRQAELREQYLANFRNRFKQQLSQIKVVDSKGNDVTPKKAKLMKKGFNPKR